MMNLNCLVTMLCTMHMIHSVSIGDTKADPVTHMTVQSNITSQLQNETREFESTPVQESGIAILHSRVKRRARHEKRNKRVKAGKISALRLVIDLTHSLITAANPDFRTGSAGKSVPYWKYSDDEFNRKQRFAVLRTDGSVNILQKGLYMVYSQMTYFDRSGRWSHSISVNRRPMVKCIESEWGIETDPDTGVLYNTVQQCHTSSIMYLNRNDRVALESMYVDRVIHTDTQITFWGFVKLT